MAEKKQTGDQPVKNETTTPTEEPDAKVSNTTTEPDKPAEAPRGRATGGEYVVIADQIVVISGTGKDAKAAVHRFGATVRLEAGQATKLANATRPAVVAAAEVKDGNVRAAQMGAIRRAMAARSTKKSKR